MNDVLRIVIAAYILSCLLVYIIPEGLFSKGNSKDRIITEKGYYRKVFVIVGAAVVVITFAIKLIFF